MALTELTFDRSIDLDPMRPQAIELRSPEQRMEDFEDRVGAFRYAVCEGDAEDTDYLADILAGEVWDPSSIVRVRRVLFEFSRAMNEGPNRAIRMIIQNHQAYALEALAECMLDIKQDDDGASGSAGAGNDIGGGSTTPQAIEPPQQAA